MASSMMIKSCPVCTNTFKTNLVAAIYCSSECKKKDNPWTKDDSFREVARGEKPRDDRQFEPIELPSLNYEDDTIAVYALVNETTNKMYIGSSISLRKREIQHMCLLNNGRHVNPHLQQSFNKYGANSFKFKVVEHATLDTLIEKEGYWIEKFFDSGRLYNVYRTPYTVTGKEHPFYGKTHSDEVKERLKEIRRNQKTIHSEATKEKLRVTSTGRTNSEESKKKISCLRKGCKLTEEQKAKHLKATRIASEKRRFIVTEEIAELITTEYQLGHSLAQLAKKHKITDIIIADYLRKSGVRIRNISEQLKLQNRLKREAIND